MLLQSDTSNNRQPIFSMPSDAPADISKEIEALVALDPKSLRDKLQEHDTNVYSMDGRAAATLKVPGFSDNSASYSSQCMLYEQAHWLTKTFGDYDYELGWTQRLVIKVTKVDANLSLTVPSAVAASCSLNNSSALVQYVVRGLSGEYRDLTGDAAEFNVDQFANYRIKMAAIFDDLESNKINVVPVVIARQRREDSNQVNRRDLFRGYAYRLCGLKGILENHSSEEWYNYLTTHGKDTQKKLQKIADELYFKACLEDAYTAYGINKDSRLSDKSQPEQRVLKNTILSEIDGFMVARNAF